MGIASELFFILLSCGVARVLGKFCFTQFIIQPFEVENSLNASRFVNRLHVAFQLLYCLKALWIPICISGDSVATGWIVSSWKILLSLLFFRYHIHILKSHKFTLQILLHYLPPAGRSPPNCCRNRKVHLALCLEPAVKTYLAGSCASNRFGHLSWGIIVLENKI